MTENIERVPPHSLESEIAVLGSMLIDKDTIPTAVEMLNKDDFYKDSHGIIFEVIKSIYMENVPVDFVTLTEELKKKKLLDRVGGAGYITSLVEMVTTSANVEHYIKIVLEKSLSRKLIKVATLIIEDSYTDNKPAIEVLNIASENIFNLAKDRDKRGFETSSVLIDKTLDRVNKILKREHMSDIVPTGFPRIDERLAGGFHKSEFVIIAARPGVGKTSFAMQIAANAAIRNKIPVGVLSLEMSGTELMFRMLCAEAKKDSHKINKGILKREDWTKMTTIAGMISEAPLYIDDSSDLNILALRTRTRRLAYELQNQGSKLGLVIIDYIQLMHGMNTRDSRQQEIADISRAIKGLAKELEIPVIGISQLSRKPEDRGREGSSIPKLSDLRESGALEQDADVVILIHPDIKKNKEEGEENNEVIVKIAKNRNGPGGIMKMMFIKEFTSFSEIEWAEQEG